jgi:hypothetical protein
MQSQFHIIKENRKLFMRLMEELTIDQINEIPAGYNNNIAWNFGHAVISFQMIVNMRSGKDTKISKEFIAKYQKGSKPEAFIGSEEVAFLKSEAIRLIEELELEWSNGEFTSYQAFTTSLGIPINNCNDAVHFAATHDMMHFGYAWAMKRLVLNKSLVTQ